MTQKAADVGFCGSSSHFLREGWARGKALLPPGDFRRPKMANVGNVSHLHPKDLPEPSDLCSCSILYPDRIRGKFPFQGFFAV